MKRVKFIDTSIKLKCSMGEKMDFLTDSEFIDKILTTVQQKSVRGKSGPPFRIVTIRK